MSTERANDRLVTVNYSARTFSCYRAKPKCNFSSSSVRWVHNVRTIVADCVDLFVLFLEMKRKRNRVGEFAKMLIRLRQCLDYNLPINPTFNRHKLRGPCNDDLHIVESFRSYSTIEEK